MACVIEARAGLPNRASGQEARPDSEETKAGDGSMGAKRENGLSLNFLGTSNADKIMLLGIFCTALVMTIVSEDWLITAPYLEPFVSRMTRFIPSISMLAEGSAFPQSAKLFLSVAWLIALIQVPFWVWALPPASLRVGADDRISLPFLLTGFVAFALFIVWLPGITVERLHEPNWKRVIWMTLLNSKLGMALIGAVACSVCAGVFGITLAFIRAFPKVYGKNSSS
jgi:hypothetical protein